MNQLRIHAPARGATVILDTSGISPGNFNPRTRTGCDSNIGINAFRELKDYCVAIEKRSNFLYENDPHHIAEIINRFALVRAIAFFTHLI